MKRILFGAFIIFILSFQIVLAADVAVSTDKNEYVIGDTVYVSSSFSLAENETVSSATIVLRIEQDGALIKESSASGTSASYQWVSDRTGVVDIKATYSWDGQSKTAQTSVSIKPKSISGALTGIKDLYYPAEQSEARITVTDQSGKVVTDASIVGSLLKDGKSTKSLYFSYSALCDCYKGWVWVDEGYQGTYTLNASVSKSGYDSVSLTKSFEVVKPSLVLTLSTDKSTYYPNEKIKITITSKDKDGNAVDAYLSGDVRDEKGFLIENLYPWKEGGAFIEDHYIKSDELGKTLNISVKGTYKEQTDAKFVMVSVTQIGLMVEAFLDKTVIKPGDYLTGKVEVKDRDGNIIPDAWVDATLTDPNGMQSKYFSTTYKDGYYVLDAKQQKVNEWQMAGDYKLKIKVEKSGEKKEIEKTIKIEKDKLGVRIELDKTSYKPGDRIYLKVLLTDPLGNVVQDGWVSGEVFPLSTETRQIEGWPEASKICRMYLSPEGPLYYQGQFIQKYFVDEVYLNDQCPLGTYVLRLKAGKSGYEEVLIEKQFEVILMKLMMEIGTNVISEVDSAQINIYAELKDENGNIPKDISIKGYFHPTEEQGCIKEIGLYFDDKAKRYTTTVSVFKGRSEYASTAGKYKEGECPEGKYNLELQASHRSYSTVNVTQTIEIKYKEGYQYSELTPIVVPEPVCKVVSCGQDCFQKVCGQENLCPVTINKECVVKCRELKNETQTSVESCVKNCEKRECTSGGSSEQEMMKKLEDIQKGVNETNEGVAIIQQMIRAIWDFFRSVFGLPTMTERGVIVVNETSSQIPRVIPNIP